MAYYIISFDPSAMEKFQKNIPFLEDAIWIRETKNLAEIKPTTLEEQVFFVDLSGDRSAIDEKILIIRDRLTRAKIIYVYDKGQLPDQRAHQMTPVGGDAYVSFKITPQELMDTLETLCPPGVHRPVNKLETGIYTTLSDNSQKDLEAFSSHPKSKALDKIFAEIYGGQDKKPLWQSATTLASGSSKIESNAGDQDMSDKDQELSLDDLGDLELSSEGEAMAAPMEEEGLELNLDDEVGLDLSAPDEVPQDQPADDFGLDLSMDEAPILEEEDSLSLDDSDGGEDELSLGGDEGESSDDDLNFSVDDEAPALPEESDDLSLSLGAEEEAADLDFTSPEGDDVSLDLGAEGAGDEDVGFSLGGDDEVGLDLGGDDLSLGAAGDDVDLSDDAKEKLKEIDAIMDNDASQVAIRMDAVTNEEDEDLGFSLGDSDEASAADSDLDKPLVSDDLDLGSINFSSEEEAPVKEEKAKKKTREVKEVREAAYDGDVGKELREISGAYSGEMERLQATISNLRSDREELLAKIQKMEEEKVMQNRQFLTIRAELDEKKIELSIIRKKLNDEITELKDRLKLHEERKLILEEKNKVLLGELDKAAQKNKIDVKKVQMRERELEQKLELLKADSETQIRHRDMKILELKRKIDAMEFDMESISVQEKRSVESRFELEDKLDKAIKTLRNAISVLEDETDKNGVLEALKKNIDM